MDRPDITIDTGYTALVRGRIQDIWQKQDWASRSSQSCRFQAFIFLKISLGMDQISQLAPGYPALVRGWIQDIWQKYPTERLEIFFRPDTI